MEDNNFKMRKALEDDYILLLKRAFWEPTEAAILLKGYYPEEFADGRLDYLDISGEIHAFLGLVAAAVQSGEIEALSAPTVWIKWFQKIRPPRTLAPELERVFLSETHSSAITIPPPVVADVDVIPDPERRLIALREMGGSAKYKNCKWSFKGIEKLAQSEKNAMRPRCDVKTIRNDLKEAAQAERDAKNAGHFDGMGQR